MNKEIINNIELYNADCFDVMPMIADKSIDMILTDPPYLHIKGGNKGWVGKRYLYKNKERFNDSFINTNMSDFSKVEINKFLDVAKTKLIKMNCIIFCSELQLQYYFNWIEKNKYKYNLIIWDKGNRVILNRNRYMSNIEYIIRIYESKSTFNSIQNNQYYSKTKLNKLDNNKQHITQKPISLINEFIQLHSNQNDIILDCFMGSGTTGVACQNTNRKFIGIEKETNYFDIAVKRIKDNNNLFT